MTSLADVKFTEKQIRLLVSSISDRNPNVRFKNKETALGALISEVIRQTDSELGGNIVDEIIVVDFDTAIESLPKGIEVAQKIIKEKPMSKEKKPAATKNKRPNYAGAKLFPNYKADGADDFSNPNRSGTHGGNANQIVLDDPGLTYESFIEKGGRAQDANFHIKAGNIRAEIPEMADA